MVNKRRMSFGAFLSTVFVVLVFLLSINSVYAYFTATANKNATINFATLTLEMTDDDENIFTSDYFVETSLIPGDTIYFSDISVENTGTTSCYVLLKIDIGIKTKTENEPSIMVTEWYNLNGELVDTSDFSLNEAGATLLESEEVYYLEDFEFTIPGDEVNDDYQGGTTEITITAYAMQSYIPEMDDEFNDLTEECYASYFICTYYDSFVGSN